MTRSSEREGLNRREFVQRSSAAATVVATASQLGGAQAAAEEEPAVGEAIVVPWSRCHDRIWLGAEFWANPLQDWQVKDGRAEVVNPARDRNVHLLTHELVDRPGSFTMSIRIGRVGGAFGKGAGSAGFRVGIRGPLAEYRNNLFNSGGLNAGLTADGRLFLGDLAPKHVQKVDEVGETVTLRLVGEPTAAGFAVTLTLLDAKTDKPLAAVTRTDLPSARFAGNVAIVSNFGSNGRGARNSPFKDVGAGKFWFEDWKLSGKRFAVVGTRSFGPILFSQYTLSRNVLTLTAQMPPMGPSDSQTVHLEVADDDDWIALAEAPIHADARTATFRIDDWNATADVPYRLRYKLQLNDGGFAWHDWKGTIRRDPVDEDVLTVADVSCNIHMAFPNDGYVERMAKLDPDLIAFTGDQFYESTAGYGVRRTPPVEPAIVDYLRKWYVHGWTWRELTRDRPSISIPDDHDVYQGNIWGEGGAGRQKTVESGGYTMDVRWVNVVHRTQTSHHPAPHDATPVKQGMTVYYGPLTYGRVSFAVIADRQFKTGPDGVAPPTGGRADHVKDPDFEPRTADVKGAELLGDRQMKFLEEWATDWEGADLKAVVSQTIFTAMATTHGGNRMRLVADYDTNGWPQTPRNEALRVIRKCAAFHIAGDQHLPAVVQYGIDDHRDAGVAFAGPAVNVGYPRWWEPEQAGGNRKPGAPENTGDFTDHFGHPLTVLAVKNGAIAPRGSLLEVVEQRASGLGIVRFDKKRRAIAIECWPYGADPTTEKQFPGWPVTISVGENDGRTSALQLPTLDIVGIANPVVTVHVDGGELVSSRRVGETRYQPTVFSPGSYNVAVGDPDDGRWTFLGRLRASERNDDVIRVEL